MSVPVALCLALYGVFEARAHRAELVAEAEHEVRETASLLGTAMSAIPGDIEAAELHALAERLTRDSRVLGVGIYDQEGRWIGGSRVASVAHEALEATVHEVIRRRVDH